MPFEIFQDVEGIGIGEHWPGKLDQMLDQARFFIPILTPSYFTSKPCRDELSKFLRAEADRGRNDLVLPIYYIESDLLEEEDLRCADPLAKAIYERQYRDWRELRFESFNTSDVRRALEGLAREIVMSRKRAAPVPRVPIRKSRPTAPATPALKTRLPSGLASQSATVHHGGGTGEVLEVSSSNSSASRKAFLCYAYEDSHEFMSAFHEILLHELRRPRIRAPETLSVEKPMFEQSDDVEIYSRRLVSQADFLILLVGTRNASRRYCLREWLLFRDRFSNSADARRRLLIVEIEDGAVEALKQENPDFAKDSDGNLHVKFHDGGQRILQKNRNGSWNPRFWHKLSDVAELLVGMYTEVNRPSSSL